MCIRDSFRWGRRCWRSPQCCYLHCLCTRVLNIKILLVLNTTNINTKHQLITSRMCSTHMMLALKLLHAGAILSFFTPYECSMRNFPISAMCHPLQRISTGSLPKQVSSVGGSEEELANTSLSGKWLLQWSSSTTITMHFQYQLNTHTQHNDTIMKNHY